jgi:endonuclease YncB( thermonuclease family)
MKIKWDVLSVTFLLVAVVALAALAYHGCSGKARASELPCGDLEAKVLRVIDGDTVVVKLNGRKLRVRMLNLDAPEIKDKRMAVRKIARKAKIRLRSLIRASKGVVQLSPARGFECLFLDVYRRALARLFVQDQTGAWVEAATILVSEGLACHRRVRRRNCDPRPITD